MAKAEVTMEALLKAQTSLKNFSEEITEIPGSIIRDVESALSECRVQLDQVQQLRERLEQKVYTLTGKIEELQNQIGALEVQIADARARIDQCNARIGTLNVEISNLNGRIASLQSQLSAIPNVPDENGNNQNAGAIAAIEAQIGSLQNELAAKESERGGLNNEVARQYSIIGGLERQINDLAVQVKHLEWELDETKAQLARVITKLNHMQEAYKRADQECALLILDAKRFAAVTAGKSESGLSGLMRCIIAMDKYLSINL